DGKVLGGPFFVTGFVAGDIPREDPAYVVEGFYAEATPQRRRAMNEAAVQTIATVNRVDWMAVGLGHLVPEGCEPTNLRQLDLWEEFASGELRGRPHPILAEGWRRLRAEVPPDAAAALCWGDCRLGNIFWDGATPVCTTDFEGATIAPAEFDLGWFLSFDRWIHEACGNPRLDGEPTREELVGVYERALGRRAVGVRWHEAFGAARYCTLVLRIMNRLEERGLLPPGSDLYLGGGVTDALRMQLEER
ncbi:MAG: phosphotransferase family protein, partial [Actinomycetota bacterium]|nr:phosphotransferase family protein [Actinomycetota bacterium]